MMGYPPVMQPGHSTPGVGLPNMIPGYGDSLPVCVNVNSILELVATTGRNVKWSEPSWIGAGFVAGSDGSSRSFIRSCHEAARSVWALTYSTRMRMVTKTLELTAAPRSGSKLSDQFHGGARRKSPLPRSCGLSVYGVPNWSVRVVVLPSTSGTSPLVGAAIVNRTWVPE